MKTIGSLIAATLILLSWCITPLAAQQPAAPEKKIVITKRSVDADGTETQETIIKRGKAAENFDVDQYLRENKKDGVEIEVRIESGSEDERVLIEKRSGRRFDWQRDLDQQIRNFQEIFDDRDKAFFGVEEDSDEDEDKEGLVVEVVCGSAADKAGLKTNDLLLKLNDTPVNRWSDLTSFMKKAKVGDVVRVTYRRNNGQTAFADVTLTRRSDVKCDETDTRRGFLGVQSDDDDDDDDDGVEIEVVDNSAAAKAGLRNGDVILQLNDTPINDWEDISDFMAGAKPGDKVNVQYRRDGKKDRVDVTLGEQKAWNWEEWTQNFDFEGFDLDVREKDACLGVYTEEDGEQRGARISGFTDESAARDASMAEGDIITSINGKKVRNHDELWNEIARFKPGEEVRVAFLRGAQALEVQATLKACQDNANEVTIFGTDERGDNRGRQFQVWNFDEKDRERLRERRVITIRKGAEGDAVKVDTNPPAPDRKLALRTFRVYPNPTQGPVTVEFRAESVPTVVSIFDLSGRQLFREELNAFNGEYNQQFDLTEYAKGAVLLHIQQADKVHTEQIVVN